MKTVIYNVMWFLFACFSLSVQGQNTTCMAPSGPLQMPGDPLPVCYTGYTAPNTGALTQFYTFTATSANMEVQLLPILGTSCSFPNTMIYYSNLQLFRTGFCTTLIATGAVFTGLTVGDSYTWGVTMTPADPVCVWIAEACPRILETIIPLPVSLQYFNADVRNHSVALEWATGSDESIHTYTVWRGEDGETWEPRATVSTGSEAGKFSEDISGYRGLLLYRLSWVSEDGVNWSETVSVRVSEDEAIRVYPNPVACESFASVEIPSGVDIQRIEIVDFNGRLMSVTTAKTVQEISTAGLAPGIYVLSAYTRTGVLRTRLVVQ